MAFPFYKTVLAVIDKLINVVVKLFQSIKLGLSMDDHIQKTIYELKIKLMEQENEVINTKKFINSLHSLAGLPPAHFDLEKSSSMQIRSDQFYGQSLTASISKILEIRNLMNRGATTVNEIYDMLNVGGFKFETKNPDNAKRSLRISLSRNTAIFHKLPSGKYGLIVWYPNTKVTKTPNGTEEGEIR